MATKTFCDRCGEEINPKSSVTYANVRSAKYGNGDDYELCRSCAYRLKLWLNEKKTNFALVTPKYNGVI